MLNAVMMRKRVFKVQCIKIWFDVLVKAQNPSIHFNACFSCTQVHSGLLGDTLDWRPVHRAT